MAPAVFFVKSSSVNPSGAACRGSNKESAMHRPTRETAPMCAAFMEGLQDAEGLTEEEALQELLDYGEELFQEFALMGWIEATPRAGSN